MKQEEFKEDMEEALKKLIHDYNEAWDEYSKTLRCVEFGCDSYEEYVAMIVSKMKK